VTALGSKRWKAVLVMDAGMISELVTRTLAGVHDQDM